LPEAASTQPSQSAALAGGEAAAVGGGPALVGLVNGRPAAAGASARARPRLRGRSFDADAAAVALGLLIAIRGERHVSPTAGLLFLAGYPVAVLWLLRRTMTWDDGSVSDELRRLVSATTFAALALLGGDALLSRSADVQLALRAWSFSLALLVIARIVARRVRASAGVEGLRPVLIVGAGRVGAELARRLREEPGHGLRPVGFLDWAPAPTSSLPLLGAPDSLSTAVAETGAECVAFAFTPGGDVRLLPLLEQCERLGLTAFAVPRLFEAVGWRTCARAVGSLPLGELKWIDADDLRFTIKHALDRLIAALLLAVSGPFMLAIAILVRLESPGPVFFHQRRIGQEGREFTMLKFRTMREPPAPSAFAPPEGCAPGGVEHEDRRTPSGVWLRRASLDELPQLINVLRGEMSLIGPRPERPEYVRQFAVQCRRYNRRHRVKSGITGLSQVSGLRGQTSIVERAEYDNFYVQNWSFWLDFKIALRTLRVVIALGGE
jgi:exopolysaccharide biosynthesis polyprenyl glycosylphosphotransferase